MKNKQKQSNNKENNDTNKSQSARSGGGGEEIERSLKLVDTIEIQKKVLEDDIEMLKEKLALYEQDNSLIQKQGNFGSRMRQVGFNIDEINLLINCQSLIKL